MAEYIESPIAADPEELLDLAYEHLQAVIPGWQPADGNLDVWLLQAAAEIAAQVIETATDVPDRIFRHYGAKIASLPPGDATSATGTTTWTVIDTDGYTIPEGTTIGAERDGSIIAFQTTADVTIPPGASQATGVEVVAVDPGSDGSGLSGDATLLDPLDYVVSVAFEGPTTGGADAEDDDAYLDRLRDELRLLAPRPILPADFATLARRIPGVGRAVAIDGYNPANQTFNNERMVTVAVADQAGEQVSTATKQAVDAELQDKREVNFVVHVVDPTYTTVDATYNATAWPDADPATVKAAADAALVEYLSPANWGAKQEGEVKEWHNETVVRYLEVAQVLQSVEGLRYVNSLTLGVNGGAQSASDKNLSGVAPLPRPGVISGTVS